MASDTIREQIRQYNTDVNNRATKQGVKIEDVRREKRGTRTVSMAITQLTNDTTPLPRRGRTVVDNPVGGTFDGINREFTLSQPVAGAENLIVGVVTQSTGTVNFPTRGDFPAPGSGSFWWDGNQIIRIGAGDIIAAGDRVFAVYPRTE